MGAPTLEELDKIAAPILSADKSLNLGLVNKSYPVLFTIGVFALTAFAGGIAVKVMFTGFGSTLRAGDVKVPAYIWLFCTVIADLTITVIILYFIIKSRTGWSGTDNILSNLARMTFESQLPPTLIAIGLAVEYTIKYDSFIAIPFICVQAKFYGISLVHTLNGRVNLKRGNTSSAENSSAQQGSRVSKSNQKSISPYYLNSSRKENTTIQVETTFDVVQDISRSEVQITPVLESGNSKRASDDGLSLNSSTYKIPQDEESKPGEYKLQNLGSKRAPNSQSPAPSWGEPSAV
ncbi:hypothetical protein BN14_08872 [Rhizoctonia solani AG-1 IB]|uniref:DUF6534 domain-containing protein n=1 Tax=Thanatephorus cucumeris (strain AG1-IB / isolate 7/3/14) TaxID=1108050 RepID=M5C631_THACB|nr:hypothetical protein BN14_08872 [Rhizoctonia solani AG-1 IB]